MFINFVNFYQPFIPDFNKIIVLFILILKIIRFSNLASKVLEVNNNEIVKNEDKANKTVKNYLNLKS